VSAFDHLRKRLGAVPAMAVDGALALLFLGFELGFLLRFASYVAENPGEVAFAPAPLTAPVIASVVALHVPLLWRQRRPLLVLALVVAGTVAVTAAFSLPLWSWGVCAAVYEVASRFDRRTSLLSAGLVLASVLYVYEFAFGADATAAAAVQSTMALLTAWALGHWSRIRRLRTVGLEREREETARSAVAEERARVARELHDILAHSISVMLLQATGAREVLPPDAEGARRALAQIEATGRQSMVEVRRLLGLLRGDGVEPDLAPSAGLDRLDELVGQVAGAGLPVSVEVSGEPHPLDPSVDLSAYRIVQEALTNVLKHAPDARVVVVRLTWGRDSLCLEVSDDGGGGGGRDRAPPPAGRGLLGMRERALLVGGALTAGPRPRRGFAVRATLPVAHVPARAAGPTQPLAVPVDRSGRPDVGSRG
jgi:signal transduction histidine kinase